MQGKNMMSYLIGCVALMAVPAIAGPTQEAADAFATGKAALAKADFDGALEAFKAAAKADPKKQEYAQQYAMLRQVLRMRKDCAKEQNVERWLRMASALRTFYHDHRLYAESLPLDDQRHQRLRSAESATLLAETQLALGMHTEAVELLGGLAPEQTSPRTGVLHGLALARQGQIDQAKKLAGQHEKDTNDAGAGYFYDLARLEALVGDAKGAFHALTRSFELTPPSQLDAVKAEAKTCKDFSTLASTAEFAKVLDTPSKIKESKCSKGTGCGKCPMRAKCGGKNTKGEKKSS